jgi:hypothetical protein
VCMKKLLLLCTVLLGAASASQAGFSVGIGIGFPIPQPVFIRRPVPVIVQPTPPFCGPAPVIVAPPCVDVVQAPVVIAPRPAYYPYRPYMHSRWEHFRGYRH